MASAKRSSSSSSDRKHKRNEDSSSAGEKKSSNPRKTLDEVIVKAIKHYDVFYNQAPPGLVQEDQERPEDCIPDLPENREAREFLAKAPTRGLWMPLGKEVKVMKCWRCKAYGHRTGDKECPMFISGNKQIEQFRYSHEDPMHDFIKDNKKRESLERVRQLQLLLEESTDDSDSSCSSSSSSSSSTTDKDSKKKKRKRRLSTSSSSSSSSSSSHKRKKKKKKHSSSKIHKKKLKSKKKHKKK